MEDNTLIVKDDRGNELLEIIRVAEEEADTKYQPINHCLALTIYLAGTSIDKIGKYLEDAGRKMRHSSTA